VLIIDYFFLVNYSLDKLPHRILSEYFNLELFDPASYVEVDLFHWFLYVAADVSLLFHTFFTQFIFQYKGTVRYLGKFVLSHVNHSFL